MAGRRGRGTPGWARHQLAFGWLGFLLGVAMFVAVGLGWQPFGREVDFGYLPIALVAMGVYVIVGINLVALLRGDPAARDEAEKEVGDER